MMLLIIKLINDLLGELNIVFENPQAIWVAFNDFREEYSQTAKDGRKILQIDSSP